MDDRAAPRRSPRSIYVLLACMTAGFPVVYAIDANFLGAQSASGLDSGLVRGYVGLVLLLAACCSAIATGFIPLAIAPAIILISQWGEALSGFGPIPDFRASILFIAVIFACFLKPSMLARTFQGKVFRRASSCVVLLSGLEVAKEKWHPIFVAANIDFHRVSGGFPHPNAFAFFLDGIFAAILLHERPSKLRIAKLSLLVIYIISTVSITGLVVLAIIVSVFARWKLRYVVICFLTSSVLVIGLITGILHFSRADELSQVFDAVADFDLNEINSGSFYWRMAVWKESFHLASTSGLFGYGMGTFSDVSGVGNLAHNVYIQILIEDGPVGFGVYIASLVMMIFQSASAYNRRIAISLVISFIVAGFTLNIFNYAAGMLMMIFVISSSLSHDNLRFLPRSRNKKPPLMIST